MKGRDWLNKQLLRFTRRDDAVPDRRSLSVSVLAHCLVAAVFVTLLQLRRSAPVMILPRKAEMAQSTRVDVASPPPSTQRVQFVISQSNAKQRSRKVKTRDPQGRMDGRALQALRARAQLETKGLVQDFKFRSVYGFSPLSRYEIALQISGAIPPITADRLPPRFEQYVMVEITISTEGNVADARIVAGQVDSKIQHTLLAAIREFKYRPATRGGIPVPSQCDLVIHIPT